MAAQKIIIVPNPILRQKSKPVKNLPDLPDGSQASRQVKKLVADLIETAKAAKEPKGVGLSAVQIGQLKRVFVIKRGKEFIPFINPKIAWRSKKKLSQVLEKEKLMLEGCLSIPGYFGFVDRPYSVELRWQDLAGKTHQEKFENKESVYVQHEFDHLNGILFVDRILKQKGKIYKLEKDKEDNDIFVEVELI